MKIICLTPVKNEEWILERFLKCASLWADHIIIADQNSTDRSVEIAKSFEKVTLIINDSTKFNEPDRQKMLLDEARKISGEKILIALDADEFLSSNILENSSLTLLRQQPIGTNIYLESLNIHPDFKQYWTKGFHYFGFVDDGSEHWGKEIDSPRLPINKNAVRLNVKDIKVLHFQYTDIERAKYKQIWYQCLEKTLNSPLTYLGSKKTNFYLFERYNKMRFTQNETLPIQHDWTSLYFQIGINLFYTNNNNNNNPHLLYIKEQFEEYGISHFRKLNIWDINWNELFHSESYSDPRDFATKAIHKWLTNRRHMNFSKKELFFIKLLEKIGLF